MGTIDRSEGQRAFGSDPAGYHDARPAYPEKIFDILRQRCGLRPHCRTFEIGAGTGLCTQRLLEFGASPLVAVESDERLANFLVRTFGASAPALDVRTATFESVDLPVNGFDLGTSASAFHWLDETTSLVKIARVLREGGWWAMWWNLFFDGSRTDEFHKATRTVLASLDRGPYQGSDGSPSFALDTNTRIANLRAVKAFENIQFETISWTVLFDTARVLRLYSTFSPITRLTPEHRERLLSELGHIAEQQFGGQVELAITTPIYTAQRRGESSRRTT
jgi:SAM-dependent methyltransferase